MATGSTRIGLRHKLALLVTTLVTLFLIAEGALRIRERIVARTAVETWAVYDEDLGYKLNPAFGDTNTHGLRDHPIGPKRADRVLMLGDSVGYYGDSIDDTWVGRMEAQLARQGISPVEVLNASVRGYTNYQELVFLKKYGVALEPDIVGVGFVLNDVHRILQRFVVEDGRIVGESYDFTPEAVESVNSGAFDVLRRSRVLLWIRRSSPIWDGLIRYSVGARFSFDARPDMNTAWRDEAWAQVDSQMREMRDLGTDRAFRLFMVVFPIADQYRTDYLALDREYVLKPQRLAARLCADLGIPCLDLYPLLGPTDFEADGIHLTVEGRQHVAEAVTRFLVASGLLPTETSSMKKAR